MAVEVGTKVAGKVTGITKFGAFVELGDGKTGLVHISEVSDAYVKDIHDVLHVGEPVTVKVLSIQDGKIGLSIRKAVDKPQQRENDHYHENRHAPAPHAGNNRFQGGARNSGLGQTVICSGPILLPSRFDGGYAINMLGRVC